MENKVQEGLQCSKCNVKLSPEELKSNKNNMCANCQGKRKKIFVATISLVALLGLSSYYYLNRQQELKGFDGVQVNDSSSIKQQTITTENETTVTVAPNVENIGETITDIDSFKRELETSKSIPSVGVLYNLNGFRLASESKSLLNYYVDNYKESKSANKILIEGYTCDLGSDQINDIISQERAEVVKRYLVSKGISEENIEIKWFGKSKFDKKSEREKQRRTIIRLIG